MRVAATLLFLLLSSDAEGGWGGGLTCPKGWIGGGLTPCSPSYAFFEFAPVSGAGMGAACAGTTPTGAKGETLTFTRASGASCTKGNPTTGIANGDLVYFPTSNVPRVMPGDSSGINGLLVESSRTNSFLQSQALDNVAWSGFNLSSSNPVVTADQAVGPDGTTTAERVDYPAVAAGQQSGLYQTLASAAYTLSFYVKGVSGSGTLDLCWTGGTCTGTCAYTSTSWTRCATALPATTTPLISSYNGRSAQSVYIWGAQAEAGAYATSYIPTTSAAVTRAAERGTISGLAPAITNAASVAATWVTPAALVGQTPLLVQNIFELQTTSTTLRAFHYPSGVWQSDGTMTPSTSWRVAGYADGTNKAACANGVCTTSAGTGAFTGSPWSVDIGSEVGALQADGVIKQICIDPSPTRCR